MQLSVHGSPGTNPAAARAFGRIIGGDHDPQVLVSGKREVKHTLTLYLALVTAVAFGGLWGCGGGASQSSGTGPSSDSVQGGGNDGRRNVVALGRTAPAGGILDISGQVGDRLGSLEVSEGDPIENGQTLGHLDSYSLRKIELAHRESQLAEAQSRLAAEEKLADARIATAESAVAQAKQAESAITVHGKKIELAAANVRVAEQELARLAALPDDLVSDQRRERQMLLVETARLELAVAEAAFDKQSQTSKLNVKAAQAELAAAVASKKQVLSAISIESLKAARDLAKSQLDRAVIVAPNDGTVLKVFVQPGETIGRTPILQMGDLERMVVVAEVYETDIKRIRLSQKANIRSRAFAPPYDRKGLTGKVVQIGRLISTPELRSLDPFAQADRRVVEVRIEVDRRHCRVAGSFVNLQVDVTFPGPDGK